MSVDPSVFQAFERALPASLKTGVDDDARAALETFLDAAVAAWPAIPLSRERLAAHLAERLPEGAPMAESVRAARAADLALACACSFGDDRAIAAFEKTYFGEVDAALARIRTKLGTPEAKQRVRERIFVAEPGERPRIALYAGTGDLRNWLRVSVTRLLLNAAEENKRETSLEDSMLDAISAPGPDPELAHLREKYRAEFRAALAEASKALSSRERTLLRYAFCDALNVDEIGALFDVHRATAARWVSKARAALLSGVRASLVARLQVQSEELESILRVIGSQLDVTLSPFLAASTIEDPPR